MAETVIEKVRKALGRREPLASAPVPPILNEPIIRLVHSDLGLPELFATIAAGNKILVEPVYVDELNDKLKSFLLEHHCKRIALPVSGLLEQVGVYEGLATAGFHCLRWDSMSLDDLYDCDASVTDVYAAIAEIGGLVVRASANHGRGLSLVPAVHVAILEPKNFVPDLVDLLQKMTADGVASGTSIITGPSKTSDIEMNLVVGVHGPVIVKVFILK